MNPHDRQQVEKARRRPGNVSGLSTERQIAMTSPQPRTPYHMGPDPRQGQELPTVAALCTTFNSGHGRHTVERFLMGYEYDGRMHYPPFRVVSMYVDQINDGDLSDVRAEQYGFEKFADIAGALTLGTGELAVDNILLVCENGIYPTNDKGQIEYPRYEWFRQVVEVFRASGRSVPVFNDKHLSFEWSKARWMYDQQVDLDFAMLAGSSLPTTWRLPELEIPVGTGLQEIVAVYPGHIEAYGIHSLEAMQCLAERRDGGETGVTAVQYLEGDEVWAAARDGRWSRDLLDAALYRAVPRAIVEQKRQWTNDEVEDLCREHALTRTARPEDVVETPVALLVEYRDGLKASCINLTGYVTAEFAVAASTDAQEVLSTLFFLGGGPQSAYHGVQVHHIEELFKNKRANYPIERTLLTSGVLAFLMESRVGGHRRIETPELTVAYDPPLASTFERGIMPILCPWCPEGRYTPAAAS